jgi:hypothetical protein
MEKWFENSLCASVSLWPVDVKIASVRGRMNSALMQ